MSLVIQEQKERKVLPSYWVYIFEIYSLGLLLTLCLAAGPFVLIALWPSIWSYISIAAVPVGIILFMKLFRSLKQWIWRNNHLDHFLLYDDRVEYILWDGETKEKSEGTIRISDIKELYYGRYVVPSNYIYQKKPKSDRYEQIALLPVLYLIHHNGTEEMALVVPFTEEMEANRWLEVLGTRGISLSLTSIIISNLQLTAVPIELREDRYLTPAVFDGNIEREFRPFYERVVEEEESREPTQEELDNFEEDEKWMEYEKELNKRKSAFRGMGRYAWPVLILQLGLGIWYVNLAEQGKVNPDGVIIPMMLILISSVLFFALVKWMRWTQIIVFHVITLFSFIFIDSSEVETDPSYRASAILLAMSLLTVVGTAIIYFIMRRLRKKQDEKNMPQAPKSKSSNGLHY
ncbi:hypothetical protein M3231_06055 [Neobacillus mesonae]|nr:hypothetical protein [Neobacillus mesonae]